MSLPVKQELRSRIVTFRLSEQEYSAVKFACGTDLSSISSVARKTLLEWVQSQVSKPRVDQRFTEIDHRLDALAKLLKLKSTEEPDES